MLLDFRSMKKKIRKTDQNRAEVLVESLYVKFYTFSRDLLHIRKTLDGTLKRLRDIRKICKEINYI